MTPKCLTHSQMHFMDLEKARKSWIYSLYHNVSSCNYNAFVQNWLPFWDLICKKLKHSIKLVGVEMVRSCWVQQQTTRPQYGILLRRSVTKASDSRLPSLKFNFIHETGMNELLKVWLSLDLIKHLLKHLQNWVCNGTLRKYTW